MKPDMHTRVSSRVRCHGVASFFRRAAGLRGERTLCAARTLPLIPRPRSGARFARVSSGCSFAVKSLCSASSSIFLRRRLAWSSRLMETLARREVLTRVNLRSQCHGVASIFRPAAGLRGECNRPSIVSRPSHAAGSNYCNLEARSVARFARVSSACSFTAEGPVPPLHFFHQPPECQLKFLRSRSAIVDFL